jgi:hypothetical protein
LERAFQAITDAYRKAGLKPRMKKKMEPQQNIIIEEE